MNRLSVNTNTKQYEITITDSFQQLAREIQNLNNRYSKIAIIADDLVAPLYLKQVKDSLSSLELAIYDFTFSHGETNKNINTIVSIYDFLIENQFDRKSLLIALGGGVTGDMVGFSAATFMRGIAYIQVPTTLLAQVDSSIGGKTGFDVNGYKNIVGAFYQPELVYINTSTLSTLPKKEFNAGMAEVIKHGLIEDQSYFQYLYEYQSSIQKLEHEPLTQLILNSCRIKQGVVDEDEKELGKRAILNFGHTIGHAIERLKGFELLHGECVSIGMMSALTISKNLGNIPEEDVCKVKDLLINFDLPITLSGLTSNEIYNEMFHDKKTSYQQLKFILLKRIGESYIESRIDKDEIIRGIQSILVNEANE